MSNGGERSVPLCDVRATQLCNGKGDVTFPESKSGIGIGAPLPYGIQAEGCRRTRRRGLSFSIPSEDDCNGNQTIIPMQTQGSPVLATRPPAQPQNGLRRKKGKRRENCSRRHKLRSIQSGTSQSRKTSVKT